VFPIGEKGDFYDMALPDFQAINAAEFSDLEGFDKLYLTAGEMMARVIDFLSIDDIVTDALGIGADSTAGEISEGILNIADGIQGGLQSVGLAISIMFFLFAMLDIITTDRFTLEYFIRFFGKLAISIALIEYAPEITKACRDFGNDFLTLIKNVGFGPDRVQEATLAKEVYINYVKELLDEAGGEAGAGALIRAVLTGGLIGLIGMIAGMIFSVIVYLVSFTRLLEMAVRGVFMPVAFGLLADDGWRGAGGRYIRKFIAVCAQGAVILLIANLYTTALGASAASVIGRGNMLMAIVCLFGLAFATISLLFKSIGVVNDIFGA